MVLKWFLHSHLTGKREHPRHSTLHSSSLNTWQLNIPFTSAIYPTLRPTPFPLVSLTCVAWVKCPTERHRFGEFSGTTNPQKWQAIGLYGEKRNTVKLTGYPDSTLHCPSFPLPPSVSHYLLYRGSCLVHFVALQASWIDSSFYNDNRAVRLFPPIAILWPHFGWHFRCQWIIMLVICWLLFNRCSTSIK